MNKQRFACLVGVLQLGLVLSGMARADSYGLATGTPRLRPSNERTSRLAVVIIWAM